MALIYKIAHLSRKVRGVTGGGLTGRPWRTAVGENKFMDTFLENAIIWICKRKCPEKNEVSINHIG